jgi:hypothetical protein
MSCTLGGLLAIIRERLPDAVVWTDANVGQWIIDALANYSITFPRTELEAEIACADSVREYDLVSVLTNPHQVTRVEYPQGEDPPTYLDRRSIRDVRGFEGGGYYDVLGSPPTTLWIGQEPDAGDVIVVTYEGDHFYPTEEDDTLTVPDGHIEALVLFVLWKAAEKLRDVEAADPQTTTLLLTQYDMMVFRAERAYWAWMRKAQDEVAESAIVSWSDIGLED